MKDIKVVDFIGLGAIGIQFGHFIEKQLGKGKVRFWADPKRTERYKRDGVYCNGEKCDFEFKTPDEAKEPADLLIFAVKSTGLKDAIELARPITGKDTIIITLMNGITSEEIIEKELGKGKVLRCVAQKMDALKTGNKVTYRDIGELCLGSPTNTEEMDQALKDLDEFFTKIGLPHLMDKDIMHRLWCKWMLNVGINQSVMVFDGNFGTIKKEGQPRDVMISAMKEVQALSKAAGINISDEEYKEYLRIADGMNPEGMPSMRQDGLNHRPSEVDFFAEAVVNKGKELGVPTPTNEWILNKVREKEAQY